MRHALWHLPSQIIPAVRRDQLRIGCDEVSVAARKSVMLAPVDRPSPPSDVKPHPQEPDFPHQAQLTPAAVILCVDDDPDTLAVLGWFLTSEGFVVVTAESVSEALLRVQERLPDFIITDCMMPGMSGLDLCRHLREQGATRHIPIIIYSALSLPAESSLYDRALLKPTDLPVFAREIRRLIASTH